MTNTLDELAENFGAFLVDQFGVLMDGRGAYAYAPQALNRLKTYGKPIYILSNSGKRAEQNIQRLLSYGFDRRSFDGVITSGEVAFWDIQNHVKDRGSAQLKVFLLSRDNDLSAIEGAACERVTTPQEAELIIIAGSEAEKRTMDEYRTLLGDAAARGVPALCTNPDLKMLTTLGQRFGAGAIAMEYQAMGGRVRWYGKPHSAIYEFALQRLGNISNDKVICFGDSPEHDLRGAHGVGCKGALVRTGLSETFDPSSHHTTQASSDQPDFIIDRFCFAGV